jgi:H+/Cl- antiporter ClcA
MPSVIVQCWLAAYATKLPAGVIVAVVAGGVLVGVVFYRYHRQLERFVVGLAAQFNRRAAVPVAEPADKHKD